MSGVGTEAFLQLRQVRKDFGAFCAVKDIDLEVQKGELICFLGPSGCGKTTLLRIIAGLELQTAGQILQAGRDISRLPPALRDYGIVFQSYALFPNLSVFDNVAYGLVNRKTPRQRVCQRVTELLDLVGLPGSESKYPGQLSGGQQQRIALARALATSPGLLLLDEPLSALDALERVRLRQEIRSLQKALGVTTIMVTHDQEEALSVADRIVVMRRGVIEQVGSPMQVYREPCSAFVADFVGKVNVLAANRVSGRLQIGRLSLPGFGEGSGPVKAYVRPEDVMTQDLVATDPQVFEADIEKIDFLGPYCQVQVGSWMLQSQKLSLHLPLGLLTDRALQVGSRLMLRLMPDRIKVF